MGDLNRPSESLTYVIVSPHLTLEVPVMLALHLINATFYRTSFSWIPPGRWCSFIRLHLAIRRRLLPKLFGIIARGELYAPEVGHFNSSPQICVPSLSVLTLKGTYCRHLSPQLLFELFRLAKHSPHLSIIFLLAFLHHFTPYKTIFTTHG